MTTTQQQKKGNKFLHTVEWLGNMLPHPVTLFMIFIVLLLITSAIRGIFWSSRCRPSSGRR